MTAAEQRVQGLTGAQRSPLADVLAEDGREIREVLAGADGTRMRIDARVRVARVDRVERFDLVTAEPDAALAKSVFFADALDLKDGQAGACCLPPSMRSLPAALDFHIIWDRPGSYQHCVVHFYRNVFSASPGARMTEVAAMLECGSWREGI